MHITRWSLLTPQLHDGYKGKALNRFLFGKDENAYLKHYFYYLRKSFIYGAISLQYIFNIVNLYWNMACFGSVV
ncbi:hypothetical protein MSP8886_00085 [Marinomonas spartinae]|uniref:Uncharacterized protein n=1 Tax=Marinomonas spartinae TaxID=1792290 RepID=A0A1A8SZY4_9GAMM|nr:hypothetical protein MSP8886_00085 [Marinomonas spartinae]